MIRDVICATCGKAFEQNYRRGQKQSFCSKRCNGRFHRKRDSRTAETKTYYHRTKKVLFDRLGNRCKCCGETEPVFLSIDHIYNDGAPFRKRGGGAKYSRMLKAIERVQILCMNCNWAKRYGPCPHNVRPVEGGSK